MLWQAYFGSGLDPQGIHFHTLLPLLAFGSRVLAPRPRHVFLRGQVERRD